MNEEDGTERQVKKARRPGWRISKKIKEFLQNGVGVAVDEDDEEIGKFCLYCERSVDGVGRETLTRHAYQECVTAEVLDLTQPAQPTLNEDISLQDRAGELIANDIEENSDEGVLSQTEEDENIWEATFLEGSKEVQRNGLHRRTAFQVRQDIDEPLNSTKKLGNILSWLVDLDKPLETKELVLKALREFGGRNAALIPSSMHVVRRAVKSRSTDAVEIRLCVKCWRHAWKPCEKDKRPNCMFLNHCNCSNCTCPVCGDGKRFPMIGKKISDKNASMMALLNVDMLSRFTCSKYNAIAGLLLLWYWPSNQVTVLESKIQGSKKNKSRFQ